MTWGANKRSEELTFPNIQLWNVPAALNMTWLVWLCVCVAMQDGSESIYCCSDSLWKHVTTTRWNNLQFSKVTLRFSVQQQTFSHFHIQSVHLGPVTSSCNHLSRSSRSSGLLKVIKPKSVLLLGVSNNSSGQELLQIVTVLDGKVLILTQCWTFNKMTESRDDSKATVNLLDGSVPDRFSSAWHWTIKRVLYLSATSKLPGGESGNKMASAREILSAALPW